MRRQVILFLVGIGFSFGTDVMALAAVESRTGSPVVRHPEHSDNHSNNAERGERNANVEHNYNSSEEGHSIRYQEALPPTSEQGRVPPQRNQRHVDALEREVTELRGQLEVQDHEIKQLKESQQALYLDLEKRVTELQVPASPPAPASARPSLPRQATPPPTSKAQAQPAQIQPAQAQPVQTQPGSVAETPRPKSNTAMQKLFKPKKTAHSGELMYDAGTKKIVIEEDNLQPETQEAQVEPQDKSVIADPEDAHLGIQKEPSAAKAEVYQQSFPEEALSFDEAYNFLRTKRYEEAITGFQNYLNHFPHANNAPNAYYWLGEIYRIQWQTNKTDRNLLDKASSAFASLTTEFPEHSKVCDAILKLGLIELEKGNSEAARNYLKDVKARFPNTSAARIADTKLTQIK